MESSTPTLQKGRGKKPFELPLNFYTIILKGVCSGTQQDVRQSVEDFRDRDTIKK